MIRRGRKLLSAAFFFILCGGALSQTAQPDQKAFDDIGEQVNKEQSAPGFAFLVWSHGSVVFAKGYGLADIASKTPVTPDTRFAVGSITKQFTAACVLLLAQQGKLSLDDKLAKYVPEMPNADRITLRILLNQDSGLHNFPSTAEHSWPLSGAIPPEKIIAILKTDKPDFAPGEKWEYSNANYAVLACIVARVSGMPYTDFLQKNIFTPLAMSSSGNGFAAQANIATPYEGSPGNYRTAEPRITLDLFYGAGSIVSTANDLARWDAALIAGKLLNAGSIHAMWTAGTLPKGTKVPYAMGFVPAEIAGHREVWHNGLAPKAGGYCYNAIFPDDDLAVIVLSNAPQGSFRGQPERMVQQVLALYDPKVPEPAAPTAAKDDPAVNALARKIFEQIIAGKPDPSLLTPQMTAALTPELVAQASAGWKQFGALRELTFVHAEPMGIGTQYEYTGKFANGAHPIVIFITADGKVGGYRVLP